MTVHPDCGGGDAGTLGEADAAAEGDAGADGADAGAQTSSAGGCSLGSSDGAGLGCATAFISLGMALMRRRRGKALGDLRQT